MDNKTTHLSDEIKREILQNAKTIMIVGLSPDTSKPSYHVASFLLEKGYDIIPIYPKGGEILGKKAFTSLKEAYIDMARKGVKCDIIDIFRKSEALPLVVSEICEIWGLESSMKDSCVKQSEIARDLDSNYNDQHSVVKLGNLDSINFAPQSPAPTQIVENLDSNSHHIKHSEISNTESKKDFSPMAQNDKILESFNTNNPCIWVQLGLHNTEAAKIAKQHGMLYEEDSCIKLEYMRIFSK